MDPDVLSAGDRFGRYIIDDVRGYGTFGVVYAARREDLPRKVALKVLHRHHARNAEVVTRFRAEANTIAELHHPHIVDVLDVGAHDGVPFLAMEYLEGETLREFLDREQRIDIKATLDLLIPIFSAVAAVHARGIVHRDLKPDNVMLSVIRPGKVHAKLLDFGVAKVLDGRPGMTRTGASVGTPYYMSPEQAEEAKETDASSDQWSLAVMLYRCVTGHYPFDGRSVLQILNAIVGKNPVPPSSLLVDCPVAFDVAVLRALSKPPSARFPSVKVFGGVLLPMASARTIDDWRDEFGVPRRRGSDTIPDSAFSKPRPVTMRMPVWEEFQDDPTRVRSSTPGLACAVAPLDDVDNHDTVTNVRRSAPGRSVPQAVLATPDPPAPPSPTLAPVPAPTSSPHASGTLSMSPRSLAVATGTPIAPRRAGISPTAALGIFAFGAVVAALYAVHATHRRRTQEHTAALTYSTAASPPAPQAQQNLAPPPALPVPPVEARVLAPAETGAPRDFHRDRRIRRNNAVSAAPEDAQTEGPTPDAENEVADDVPAISERLARADVARVIQHAAGDVRRCTGGVTGRLVLRVSVNPDGHLEDLRLSGVALDASASDCVEQFLRSVEFPMSLQGAPSADYPITLGEPVNNAPRSPASTGTVADR